MNEHGIKAGKRGRALVSANIPDGGHTRLATRQLGLQQPSEASSPV